MKQRQPAAGARGGTDGFPGKGGKAEAPEATIHPKEFDETDAKMCRKGGFLWKGIFLFAQKTLSLRSVYYMKKISLTAEEIARHLGGEVVGNPAVTVSAPARIESGRPGTICFLANPKYEHYLYGCKADIVLVNRNFEPRGPVSATLVKVDDAYASVASLLDWFEALKAQCRGGNSLLCRLLPGRSVALSARIGKGTRIYPQAYIGPRVRVGKECIIYPGVKIYHDCVIGDRCVIHANAVIGADGFGFAPQPDGSYRKIPQTGNVVIESDVEIGAGTTVDRSTMGSTIIRRGTKIDNLCMIAHNVEVGEDTVMAAQCGIAGSTRIGSRCVIAGQCGIAGHLTIADRTTIGAQSGIMSSIETPGKSYFGYPALEHREFLRAFADFRAKGRKR